MTISPSEAPSPERPALMQQHVGAQPQMLTRAQLSARWQCSVGHLANLASADRGPNFIKLGSSVRYRLSDVEAYEEAMEVATFEATTLGLCA